MAFYRLPYSSPKNSSLCKFSSEIYSQSLDYKCAFAATLNNFGYFNQINKQFCAEIYSINDNGLLLAYIWPNGETLYLPIVNDTILLSKGDIIWLQAYPFVKEYSLQEGYVDINLDYFQQQLNIQSPCFFSGPRPHFGHLIRDFVYGELSIMCSFIERMNIQSPLSMLRLGSFNDTFLESIFYHSIKSSVFDPSKIIAIEHSSIITGDVYFTRRTDPSRQVYSSFMSKCQSSIKPGKIVYLGLGDAFHERIENASEIKYFLDCEKIPCLNKSMTHTERLELLHDSQIVIAEPSSSFYNYLLYCSSTTKCIMFLPEQLRYNPSERDSLDWSVLSCFIPKNLLILPSNQKNTDHIRYGADRIMDNNYSYDIKRLKILINCLL